MINRYILKMSCRDKPGIVASLKGSLVMSDLDEGPIIEQDVEHITHADQPEDLIRIGRDIERRVWRARSPICWRTVCYSTAPKPSFFADNVRRKPRA